AKRALEVVDAGVITVSAPDGIEPITSRAIGGLQLRRAPFAVFVSKLDKEGADFAATVEEIKGEVDADAAVLAMPMGAGSSLTGVVSLLSRKAYVADGDKTKEVEVP